MMKSILTLVVASALAVNSGCKSAPKPPPTLSETIATTHGLDDWRKQKALAGRFAVALDGGPMEQGKFVHEVDTLRLRIDLEDAPKTTIVSSGSASVALPTTPHLDFFTRVWPMLLTLPFRLEGANVEDLGEKKLGATSFRAARVMLAGHEWIEIYVDPAYKRLAAVAYPVSREEARAVTFYDFKQIDGVRFATEWKFWKWTAAEGIYGQPIGGARLLDLEFRAAKKGTFDPPH